MEKILVIAGSNYSKSINQWFANELGKYNNVDYFDTRLLNIPDYSTDIEDEIGIPKKVIELYDLIHSYQKLIIISPEYNGNAPSFLKSITDWLSRYKRFYLEDVDVFICSIVPGKRAGASVREMLATMLSNNHTKANILGDIGVPHFDKNNDYTITYQEILNYFK